MAKKRTPKPPKGAWVVTLRCVVIKEVVCKDCTEEEARSNPWDHAVDERETGQEDWEFRDIHRDN